MSRPIRITPPAALPVSLEEFKSHSAIDFVDDDAEASALLDAAVSYLDGYAGVLGRCLVSQDWKQGFADWCARLRLPFPDVSSVSVSYLDESGLSQSVNDALFEVVDDASGCYVRFKDAFASPSLFADAEFPISVEFTAGYGGASDVPAALRVAIKLLAAHWYQAREATSSDSMKEIPFGVSALIAPFRRVGF